jgi:DNA invertase Pin-like site-specific DNA recombinase
MKDARKMSGAVVETWAYCRYSSDKQNDRSIEQQISEIERICQRLGLPAPGAERIYSDRAKSGKSVKGRDQLARLLADAQQDTRRVRRVLMLWDVDRLGRNLFESIGIAGRLYQGLGFRIATCDGLDSDHDRFKADLVRAAESADYFITRLRRNVKRGLEDARRKGHWLGKCPVGYRRVKDEKTIVPDPEQLRWIGFAFAEAHRLRGHVAAVLRTLRARTGAAWHKRTLIRVLRSPRYVEAGAVSREVFDQVQEYTSERGKIFNRAHDGRLRSGAGTGRSPLLSLFKCGLCQSPIVTTKRDLTDRRLGCRAHNADCSCENGVTVREGVLIRMIVSTLQERLLDGAGMGRLIDMIGEEVEAMSRSAELDGRNLATEIADRERRIGRLVKRMEESDDAMPELEDRLRELRAEVKALRAKEGDVSRPISKDVVKASIRDYLPRLSDMLAGQPDELRAVLPDVVKDGVMFSEGRGKSRFEMNLLPLGALATLAPSVPLPSSRATPSPASSCWR